MKSDFEIRTADWLSFEEARRRIIDAASPTEGERVPAEQALGRALAEPLTASATLPAWDNSAMDGYAVRGDDVAGASPSSPVVLDVVGVLHAGEAPSVSVDAGQAVRIMTGAPIPEGADSVVRVEDTDREDESGTVRVLRDRDRGRNVRPAGLDMRPGDTLLTAGDPVGPGALGVAAALGLTHLQAHRPLRVAILVTGDELRGPERYDEVRAGSGVPDSNGPMLAAQVLAAGAHPERLEIARDEPAHLESLVSEAGTADALVTVGGASMGEADLLKRVLDGMGFELDFWRARIRPGSPVSFGRLPREHGAQPVFGLPGNPASAFVTFELFVRPFLLRSAGHRRCLRRTISCVAGEDLPGPSDLRHFLRVSLDSTTSPPTARTTAPQSSGLVRSLGTADGLAVVPEETESILEGAAVEVILLGDGPGGSDVVPPGGER